MPQRPLSISPFLRVEPLHAVHHAWSRGQEICGPVSGNCVFWLVQEGEIEVENARRSWTLGAGSAFLFALTGERRVATQTGAKWLSLSLRAVAFDTLDLLALLPLPAHWKPEEADFSALQTAAGAIVREWGAPNYRVQDARTFDTYLHHQRQAPLDSDATRAVLCEGYTSALFALLWRQLAAQNLSDALGTQFPSWMPLALVRMRENPALGVEELAKAVGLSRRHLGREFHRHFGASPREFLNRRRLEAARQQLESSERTLSEIARQSGFADLSHFHRAFKTAYGISPEKYRAQSRLDGGLI